MNVYRSTWQFLAVAAACVAIFPALAEDKAPPPAAPSKTAPKVETKTFVNSKEGLEGNQLPHYVDFSFDYPAGWKITSGGKGGGNFVRAERALREGTPPKVYTLEQINVGTFFVVGPAELAPLLVPQLLDQQNAQFARQFDNYKKISIGEVKVGDYRAHELRFSAEVESKDKGPIKFFGRCILVPDPKAKGDGVMLILLATNLAEGITGIDDVGVKGELPVILKSFRLGKPENGMRP